MTVELHDWKAEAVPRAEALLQQLRLGDRDWHTFKGDRQRRAAEQLAAALALLLHDQADAAIQHLEEARQWLQRQRRDPGCPDRRPQQP
ncbi:MAG: hypothetical protein ERJ67_08905 [Aphanocapsa feldmannii 277cV]|uniref:Uncharacterized protein n=2 Tax=Aphanocapsa feldmannii TaxID=192050 RepID=A0A524RL94_9CHRO|nr:MAG: hypothetical protein ERJ69_07710 [Aphanocapsa feldmannii 288cV]TGG90841.1 MAG: hypothetical protein ERJ67_08905 [Aphanocapsa feldmannii 277cV]TGH22666.1 MAG: hypothetical protein ERJ68_04535 [Aphanocapsa feldmannii 277cI]